MFAIGWADGPRIRLQAPGASIRFPTYAIWHWYRSRRVADMMTVEECRRKAAEWLGKTQAASDPKTSASMRRASDAWTTLAQHIEHSAFSRLQSPAPVRRPADLAEPRKIGNIDTVRVADILRERLQLGVSSMDEPPDSTSGS